MMKEPNVCLHVCACRPLPLVSAVLVPCSLLAAEQTYVGSEDFLSWSS